MLLLQLVMCERVVEHMPRLLCKARLLAASQLMLLLLSLLRLLLLLLRLL
jgi:hypothetical protein